MQAQIQKDNAGLNITNFLKWIMENPDKKKQLFTMQIKRHRHRSQQK